MNKEEPWDFWVLEVLRDGKTMSLKAVYDAIETLNGKGYIKQHLYKADGKWGDRPDYTHRVRSTMSSLKKRGMVEHRGEGKRTGLYRITDAGTKYLEKIEP